MLGAMAARTCRSKSAADCAAAIAVHTSRPTANLPTPVYRRNAGFDVGRNAECGSGGYSIDVPPPVALTIAGSDPSGGAGIQADLKIFHQFGVYGEAVLTLLTVQNTTCVERVECLKPELVSQQLRAVLDDIPPNAIKTGALGDAAVIGAIAAVLRDSHKPLVVDPVIVSKHHARLMSLDAQGVLVREMFPLATLVTPNLDEAAALTGLAVDDVPSMKEAAKRLVTMGAKSVLVKGGHLGGDAVDILFHQGALLEFSAGRIETRNTHGAGCTYSAAITAELARGSELAAAIGRAKRFVTEAIRTAPGLGKGAGPLNHFADGGI